jgi:hypothetical protein
LALLRGGLKTATGIAAGVIGGALAVVPAAAFGALTGALAGWRGVSLSGTHKPASQEEMEVLTNVVDELLETNGLQEEPQKTEKDTEPLWSVGRKNETTPVAQEHNDSTKKPADSEDLDLSPLKGLFKGRVAKGIKQLLLWPSEGMGIKTHEAAGRKLGEFPGRVVGALTGAVTGALFNALAVGGVALVGIGFAGANYADKKLSLLESTPPEKGDPLFYGRFETDDKEIE